MITEREEVCPDCRGEAGLDEHGVFLECRRCCNTGIVMVEEHDDSHRGNRLAAQEQER